MNKKVLTLCAKSVRAATEAFSQSGTASGNKHRAMAQGWEKTVCPEDRDENW